MVRPSRRVKTVEVAFSGWATALLTGVLFTIAITVTLRWSERRRDLSVARATAKHDLWRNLMWLAYHYWQARHPAEAPRDHEFGSFELFPQYAPVLIADKPNMAGTLMFIQSWASYVRDGSRGSLTDDDMIDIWQAGKRLNEEFAFGWDQDLLERLPQLRFDIR